MLEEINEQQGYESQDDRQNDMLVYDVEEVEDGGDNGGNNTGNGIPFKGEKLSYFHSLVVR